MTRFDLLIKGGTLVTAGGVCVGDVGVRDGRIAALGAVVGDAAVVLDARHLHLLPGLIDTQVHFREPGLEHKEDLSTGTAAAALGGITAIFEMPNTVPPTDSAERLVDKLTRAAGRAHVDFAFFVGATVENATQLGALERLPGCAGVKVFMGSSTGSLLVDEDEALCTVLASGSRRLAVHAEDEARLKSRRDQWAAEGARVAEHPIWRDVEVALCATQRLIRLARTAGRPVHVLHVSSAEELAFLAAHKDIASVEATPQHLLLSAPEAYERLGTLAQMNPPIRGLPHQQALWRGISDGTVDVLGSDHAPHTRDEKARPYPQSPSGMPGVQTMVPLMLDAVNAGRLSLMRLCDLLSAGPARLFGIAGKGRLAVGYDADLTLVDLCAEHTLSDNWIKSRAGWTPFAGRCVRGMPVRTLVRGHSVMVDGELAAAPVGQPVRFISCDQAPSTR